MEGREAQEEVTMKRHTSNRLVALILLALLASAPATAHGRILETAAPADREGSGVRFELAIRADEWVGRAVVAIERAPIEMLTPAWMASDRCSLSRGLLERLHRAAVLVRALGRAAWAVLKQQADERGSDTSGTKEEDSDADRRRSA